MKQAYLQYSKRWAWQLVKSTAQKTIPMQTTSNCISSISLEESHVPNSLIGPKVFPPLMPLVIISEQSPSMHPQRSLLKLRYRLISTSAILEPLRTPLNLPKGSKFKLTKSRQSHRCDGTPLQTQSWECVGHIQAHSRSSLSQWHNRRLCFKG